MDAAQKYLEQARAAGLQDEDIIFELTKQGWSIPQVHKLVYGSTTQQSPLFTSRYNPPYQPTGAPSVTPPVQTAPTTMAANTLPSPTSQMTSPVEPQMPMNQAMRHADSKSKMNKFVKFSAIAVGFIIVGTLIGIGVSYLYFQSQVSKYSNILETGTIGLTSLDPAISDGISEIASEDGATQPNTESIEINPESGEVVKAATKKTETAKKTAPKTGSNVNAAETTSCKVNKSIPGGVCDAIASLLKDPSASNPYLSDLDLSGVPGGVKITSIDEKSWQVASGGGAIDAVAVTALGQTNIRATMQQKGSNWKVVGLQIL